MTINKKLISNRDKTGFFEYLNLIWDYRFFSKSLAVGEIKNRYARLMSGVLLGAIQMLLALSIYWLVFGLAIGIDTGKTPYPLFVLPGLIAWQFFSYLVSGSAQALTGSEHLINKLYFPRINLALSRIIPASLDFLLGLIIFVVFFLAYRQELSFFWLYIALIYILLIVCSLAFGLWTSILSLYIRDLSQIMMQLIGFMIFVTPVFYPGTLIPDSFKFILYLNPLAGIIELFRAFTLQTALPDIKYAAGFVLAFILFIAAVYVYKKIEPKITDML